MGGVTVVALIVGAFVEVRNGVSGCVVVIVDEEGGARGVGVLPRDVGMAVGCDPIAEV